MIAEFSDKVTESRKLAEQAALDVPGVQYKVAEANQAITSISEELNTASERAKNANDLAQQAQKQYADKASEVNKSSQNSPMLIPNRSHRFYRNQ